MILDRDFMSGMCHRVRVTADANKDGSSVDERGAVRPDFQPVPGLESVPCRVSFSGGSVRVADRQPDATESGLVLIPGRGADTDAPVIAFDHATVLEWYDPGTETTRNLSPQGRVIAYPDLTGAVHHYAVSVVEFVP